MEEATENNNNIYCPICQGKVEKTGKPGWALCPVHGWIKYKSREEQEKEDIFSRINLKSIFLAHQAREKIGFIRSKSTIITIIILAIVVTGLLGFVLGYFDLKGLLHESLKIKSLKVPVQKGPVKEARSQVPVPTEKAQSQVSVSPKATPLNEKTSGKKETKEKSIQYQHPSKPIFTVQAGAFRNFSSAKSLKKMLLKKGYATSITTSKLKKKILYKVRIGKFSERKEAETIAEKIRKEVGIQTFVAVLSK